MQVPLYNQNAEKVGQVDLPDQVFGLPMNADLLHQVVTSQSSNQRQNLAHAKGRSEVRGGGKKPWRQKGTGRARHGSTRSPIWKGGGVTHGPTKERDFTKKINKKMAKKALFVALSSKVRDGQIIVVDDIKIKNRKTKEIALLIKAMTKLITDKTTQSMLIVIPDSKYSDIKIAVRNIPKTDILESRNLNSALVLSRKYLLVIKDSLNYFSPKTNQPLAGNK